MQCTLLTNPKNGNFKTGYSYPMKTELCPWWLKKGSMEILAVMLKRSKDFI
ncbi:hypothetical protein CA2559_11698 [Croceibacter atlanticus HTCC2559]|jgi:hypothetical protein|uniref:Uncharacterized protein n=1 Tax=Croceibacter atlanticus (strain ATCC BAA-628 / JCM 21780 / CIP 108009 / IAM 15332 / KCTC 12090 / HTCC2559) TaxID=216432 RepID=A3UA62_CROAH|nr:hypothetical protein CA2559_11698 [Croceibacter atlanticus HTCC2559]|tara:strand:+ start:2046 stop:2198 length:153 start_codon:yes stop_codon:yes gene_type:complete